MHSITFRAGQGGHNQTFIAACKLVEFGLSESDAWELLWETPFGAFRDLWESINGPGSWDLNPWVWVIQFRKVERSGC